MLGSTFSKKLDDVTLGGALNQGVLSLILLIGLFTWFYPARIVRSLILSLRGREFVEAAEMVGSSDGKDHANAPVPARDPGTRGLGDARGGDEHHARGGDHVPRASGSSCRRRAGERCSRRHGARCSRRIPYNPSAFSPWLTLIPSLAIFLTVLALTLFGEGLREAFDPRGVR